MRIQHNIAALNTHRNLAFNNTQTSKALEKLSSGYKINRAGDDAAGLAISEKMRGQIRGLDMASKNAQDGISLIQTAEGALNETHSILQRMRELAVQAGNDTNTTDDRGEIQKEINQLTSEINRIGNTTEFNTKKLVNGELSADYQAASKKSVTTDVTEKVVKAADGTVALGVNPVKWTDAANASVEKGAKINVVISGTADNGMDWSKIDTASATHQDLMITRTSAGFTVDVNVKDTTTNSAALSINADQLSYDGDTKTYSYDNDGIKFSFTAEDAKDWAVGEKVTIDLAANATATYDTGSEVQGFTAVAGTYSTAATTTVTSTSATLSAGTGVTVGAGQAVTVETAYTLSAGAANVIIGGTTYTAGDTISAGETLSAGTTFEGDIAIKTVTTTTTAGGTANKTEANMGNITVSASEQPNLGRVDVSWTESTGAVTITLKDNTTAATTLSTKTENVAAGSTTTFSIDGVSFDFTAGGATPAGGTALTNGSFTGSFKLKTEERDEATGATTTTEVNTTVASNGTVKFQIGANENQAIGVSFSDMRASALGITRTGMDEKFAVTNGTDDTVQEQALDITSHSAAASAISVLDEAIAKVSSERAKLGAVQNRLEHTINNLGTSSENLTAAESRIRDTDMAASMMEFTKNNILTQAAQSMLAQANQQPQGVLQLLG